LATNLRPPLRWFGGKQRLAPKLIPLIPTHSTYVEVFAGGAAVFFAKEISPLEVINDLDSGIVNLYRVLRDKEKFQEFRFRVALSPFSREEYEYCRATWWQCEDDVEKARRWFVVTRQCFGGIFGSSFGVSVTTGKNGMAGNVASYLKAIDRLPEISARFMRVQIENKDFRDIIKQYDRPTTFFYLDPPYVADTRKSPKVYAHEMTDADHQDLVELLLNLKGKAMLSGYDTGIYKPLEEAGWDKSTFKAYCSVSTLTANDKSYEEKCREECAWIKT
jgi:DNA adenine methylase